MLLTSSKDIIGPNSVFVSQSATFPKAFTDLAPEDVVAKTSKAEETASHALQNEVGGVETTPETMLMWHFLAGRIARLIGDGRGSRDARESCWRLLWFRLLEVSSGGQLWLKLQLLTKS